MADNGLMASIGGNSRGRQLGFSESVHQLFVTKYSYDIYWNIGIIQSTNPLQERHVAKALKILARTQEALQMQILPYRDPKQEHPN